MYINKKRNAEASAKAIPLRNSPGYAVLVEKVGHFLEKVGLFWKMPGFFPVGQVLVV